MNKTLFFLFCLLTLFTIIKYRRSIIQESFVVYKGYEMSPKLSIKDVQNWSIAQKKLTKMLYIFIDICNNAKPPIQYCAIGGTLIGAIRHKGWVPWDGDVDIAMTENEYNRFYNECKKPENKVLLSKNSIWLQSRETTKVSTKYLAKFRDLNSCYSKNYSRYYGGHTGLQLDIFILLNKNGKLYYGNYKRGWEPNVSGMDYKIMFPPKKMKFENMLISVPNEYQRYSRIAWGSYPPKVLDVNKRIPHEGKGYVNPHKPCKYVIKQYPELYKNLIFK